MAITLVQSTSAKADNADKAPTAEWDDTPTPGNLLVFLAGWSEDKGNASINLSGWTQIPVDGDVNLSGKVRLGMFWKVAGASENNKAKATLNAARRWTVEMVEVNSTTVGAGWQVDVSAHNSSSSSSSATSGTTATTTTAAEFWVAGFACQNQATLSAATNGFTIIEQQVPGNKGAEYVSGVMLTKIAAAAATAFTGGSYSNSRPWVGTIATFHTIIRTVSGGASLAGAGFLTASPYYSTPSLLVQAAFGYGPGDADPVWADVSSYARSCQWQRGRQNELNQTQAGTATVVLNDEDSHWDPNNTASPLYPYVKPGLPVRAILFVGGVVYPLFYCFAERLPRTSRVTTVYTQRQLDLVDGFALLAAAGLGGFSYPLQDSDERLNDVLDDISWAAAKRRIGAGASEIQEKEFPDDDDTRAQAHLQAVNDSENGFFFCDGDGNLVFIGRHELISDERYTVSQATFSDANSPAVEVDATGYGAGGYGAGGYGA